MACQNENAKEKPDWERGFCVKTLFQFTSSSLSLSKWRFCHDDQTLLVAFSQGEKNHNYVKHVIYQSLCQQSTLAL